MINKLAAMMIPSREKLSLRLLFWILLLSTFLAFIATTIQLYTDYRDSKQSLETSLIEIEDSVLPSVAVAMWKLDKEVIESILGGLLTQSGVLYAEVIDTYGNPVLQLGEVNTQSSFDRSYLITFSKDNGESVYIGELKVTATLAEIYRQLFDKAIVILLTQGLKTFFMSICILILVERMVIRHLNHLAHWANNVDLANPAQFLSLPRRKAEQGDVIDNVNQAINTMQSNLIQALAEREKTERLIKSIINNSPSFIYAKDLEGRYIMLNQRYRETIGLSEDKIIGRTASELFSHETASALQKHDAMVIEKAKSIVFDEKVNPQGVSRYFMSAKFPIFDEHGDLVGTGGVSTEITDRREKEQQIIELNESLENKVRLRTQELEASLENLKETQTQLIESEKMSALGNLVGGVAHEINTPLGIGVTAASHMYELIRDFEKAYLNNELQHSHVEHLIDATQESVDILQFNLNRAVKLIRNFKQVAVDQSSEMKRQFELGSYLDEVAHGLIPQLKKSGHTIKITADESIVLDSYPGAIAQIITNLVMNSIKHGFKDRLNGAIEITLTRVEELVCMDYKDNGTGLTNEQREKVFEPFFTTARAEGGSGLGMSISYNLVINKLAGKLTCLESEEGAHFRIVFPLDNNRATHRSSL